MRNDLGGPPQLVVWRCFTMTKSGWARRRDKAIWLSVTFDT